MPDTIQTEEEMMSIKLTDYYWFEPASGRLRHGDGRVPAVGVTHAVDVEPKLGAAGLHASQRPLDALGYAHSQAVWVVHLGGDIIHRPRRDQTVATERTYVRRVEIDLRRFARLCALDVVGLWSAPAYVLRYLRTGDESLRAAARVAAEEAAVAAARSAAEEAAWAAARAAAEEAATDAARDTAWSAAWAAAWAAKAAAWGATRGTAWSAAEGAARDRQNRRLLGMIWRGGV
jgi:hypothetical protein